MAVDVNAFGRTLAVTNKGEVYYHENGKYKKIKPYMHQGKKYVRIAVPEGKSRYHQHRVDQLVCFAFKTEDLEQRQKIEYVDGNPENCAATNLRIVSKRALLGGTKKPHSKSSRAPLGSSERKCCRGHKITGENIYSDKRYPNSYACKACSNARNWLRGAKRKDLLESEDVVSLVADVYYDKHVLHSENFVGNWDKMKSLVKTASGPEEFVL